MSSSYKRPTKTWPTIEALLVRRAAAVRTLMDALAHLSREQQYTVLTSWMSIKDLENLAKIQKIKPPESEEL